MNARRMSSEFRVQGSELGVVMSSGVRVFKSSGFRVQSSGVGVRGFELTRRN
jgi:hypothetical protein